MAVEPGTASAEPIFLPLRPTRLDTRTPVLEVLYHPERRWEDRPRPEIVLTDLVILGRSDVLVESIDIGGSSVPLSVPSGFFSGKGNKLPASELRLADSCMVRIKLTAPADGEPDIQGGALIGRVVQSE